jgi:hypothetical protein
MNLDVHTITIKQEWTFTPTHCSSEKQLIENLLRWIWPTWTPEFISKFRTEFTHLNCILESKCICMSYRTSWQEIRAGAWVWRRTSRGRRERGGSAARPEPKFGGSRFWLGQRRQAPEHNLLLLNSCNISFFYAMSVHLCSGVDLKP